MAYFRRDDRSGGNRSFGGGDRFNRRSSGPREMHKAVCNNCGRDCEVPFKPTGSKPVYCSDCFEKQENRESRPNRFEDRGRRPNNFESRNNTPQPSVDQFREMNSKLDKIIYLLQSQNSKKTEEPRNDVTIADLISAPEAAPQVEKAQAPVKKAKRAKKAESTTKTDMPAGIPLKE